MSVLPIKDVIEVADLATGEIAYFRRAADKIDAALPEQPTHTVWFDIEIDRGNIVRMRAEEMTIPRRTLIALMGLAPASVALGGESFIGPPETPGDIQPVSGSYTNERFAQAFEQLAVAARAGALSVEHIRILSELSNNEIADKTELKIILIHKPEIAV